MKYDVIYTQNGVKKTLEGVRVTIDLDDWWEGYRDDHFKNDDVKIHVLDFSRDYSFQKDFGNDEDFESKKDDFYLIPLDFYDHSTIRFSLAGKYRENIGYYEFDRTRNVGVIGVRKNAVENMDEAVELAQKELENYNHFINGWIYYFTIDENIHYISEDGERELYNRDVEESCGGFIDFEDCKNEIKARLKTMYFKDKEYDTDSIDIIEK